MYECGPDPNPNITRFLGILAIVLVAIASGLAIRVGFISHFSIIQWGMVLAVITFIGICASCILCCVMDW